MVSFGPRRADGTAGPPRERAVAIAEATRIFTLAESLGGVESLIEIPAAMTHLSVAGSALEVPDALVRLSVGIEQVRRPRPGPRARPRRAPEPGTTSGARPQPFRNRGFSLVLPSRQSYDCGSRLSRATGSPTRGRSIRSRRAGRCRLPSAPRRPLTDDHRDRPPGVAPRPTGRTNLSTAALYELPSATARARSRPRVRSSSGPAPTPAVRRRTSSSSASRPAEAKVWWGDVNHPISEEHYDRLRARLMAYLAERRPVQPGPASSGPIRPIAGPSASTRRRPGPASSPATCSGGRPPTELADFAAELHDHRRPVVPGRPGDRGHADRDGDPRPPQADGDHHRRHRVRRRDQEVGVHGDELPDAGRGRPADALVDQRRRGRRRGDLLRPLRHGQDDAVGRPAAEPDRRRRARLGRRLRLQLRGRLLRQDDPPLADVRAGHLRRRRGASGRSSRTSTSTRRPASSTSIRSGSPRTPAAPTRSTSSATPTRPGSPASRATSSS